MSSSVTAGERKALYFASLIGERRDIRRIFVNKSYHDPCGIEEIEALVVWPIFKVGQGPRKRRFSELGGASGVEISKATRFENVQISWSFGVQTGAGSSGPMSRYRFPNIAMQRPSYPRRLHP